MRMTFLKFDSVLQGFIIHSKFFPNSDWLKAHAWFTMTSYWWPNLEEFVFNEEMTSKMQPSTG